MSSVRRQICDCIPFPKTRYADGTGMILLGQAELLALEVTNIQIHLLDLTAIPDTAMAEFISQAWRRETEPWSWLCSFLSDGSRRVRNSICSVSSRMHKASSCLPTPRLCESSRSEAQRWDSTSAPAKPRHFPAAARIVFSPPAVPVPLKEKLQDERQRNWPRPSTCSWEIMLGMRKTCKGNTQKSQPSNVPSGQQCSVTAPLNRDVSPTLWLPKKCKLPFRYKPGAATTVFSLCLVPVPLKSDCQKPKNLIWVSIEQEEHSAAAWGSCTPLNQVLPCKASCQSLLQ